MNSLELSAKLPRKLSFLLEKRSRYKVAWGGRGSAKSWSFARALVLRTMGSKVRVLCAREHQTSIEESVHRLLSDQIHMMGLDAYFTIQTRTIKNTMGSEFIFAGIATDPDKIKSTEGVDICWVEEAENVTDRSWETLIPTIRTPGSEIWISFNPPQTRAAPTWQRFVLKTPENAIVVKVSWRDNPWFPDVLDQERRQLERDDPVRYRHVWEGEIAIPGSVYFPVDALIQAEQNIQTPLAVGELMQYGDEIRFVHRKDGWLEVFEMPEEEEHYVLGSDVSEGTEDGDQHSAHVLKRGIQTDQVARFASNVGADELGRLAVLVCKWFNGRVPLAFERTGGWGAPAIVAARDTGYPHMFRMPKGKPGTDQEEVLSDKLGWETSTSSRPELLSALYAGLLDQSFLIRSEKTLDQFRTFVKQPHGGPKAAPGCHDDEVLGIGIANQVLLKTQPILKPKLYTPKRSYRIAGSGSGAWMGA